VSGQRTGPPLPKWQATPMVADKVRQGREQSNGRLTRTQSMVLGSTPNLRAHPLTPQCCQESTTILAGGDSKGEELSHVWFITVFIHCVP
jgi:hypothetical protein